MNSPRPADNAIESPHESKAIASREPSVTELSNALPLDPDDQPEIETSTIENFLIESATMLHRYGTPAYRLERVMQGLALQLNVNADFLYTPTSLLVAFHQGKVHRVRLQRIEPSGPELGKLIDLDSVMDEVADQTLSCDKALARLTEIDLAPSRYGFWALLAASFMAAACVGILLGSGLSAALFAGCCAALIHGWDRLLQIWFPQEHLLEITAGFLSAIASIFVGYALSGWDIGFNQNTACLASLIILVPGFSFTVAVAELASRHLSCGVARLAGSAVVFLALVCGVALAWRLGAAWRLPTPSASTTPFWLYSAAIFATPFSLAMLFQARIRDFAVIVVVAWIGFATTMFATQWQGQEFGAFTGALAIGAVANLYARYWDRPAMVAQMPGILMLVPGSVGYQSLTAFVEKQGAVGLESAFAMVMIAISLVGGLLTSNLVVPPKRIL